MVNIRVYEFAKQHGLSSKDLLDFLKEHNIDVKSHMSVLTEQAHELLYNKFVKKPEVIDKKSKEAPLMQQPVLDKSKKINASVQPKNPSIDASVTSQKVSQPSRVPSKKPYTHRPFTQQPAVKKQEPVAAVSKKESPLILRPLIVGDFAEKIEKPVVDVIVHLLKKGLPCTKNHLLTMEQVASLARDFGVEVTKEIVAAAVQPRKMEILNEQHGEKRLPVVVVMGHVDHGKTSLLDYIRKTRVAAREKGGITQHIGAYEAQTPHGNIVFLDTPGHEAFSKVRKRGAAVADIAVLVVAADDGVMPQTVESIKAIKASGITPVVAVNKMDKVDPTRIETIRRQLSQYDITPEEWGGDVVFVPVSAKTGAGIDHLLEVLALQAEVLELKAVRDVPAQGYVLESKMQKGRGVVATLLCREGVLRVGDFIHADDVYGKVVSLVAPDGSLRSEVEASVPVVMTGFENNPAAGSFFNIISESDYRKKRSDKDNRTAFSQATQLANVNAVSSSQDERLAIIVKADTHSSLEAVLDGIEKVSKNAPVTYFVIQSSIGDVTESDVVLAENTSAEIITFNCKINPSAIAEMRRTGVQVKNFDIIYKLFETLEAEALLKKKVEMVSKKIGEATVLKVFNIKKFGVVAGCYVRDGRIIDKAKVAILRNKKQIATGKIKSLQRDKRSVKEVHSGFECAFLVDGFEDWQQDDIIECFTEVVAS